MSKVLAILLLLLVALPAHAQRLSLSIGARFPGNGAECVEAPASPFAATTRIGEGDVAEWSASNAKWKLDPSRFPASAAHDITDRCFELAIDGRLLERGLVLSSHSARLTGFATISVSRDGGALWLQLTSGNHGMHVRALRVEELDRLFFDPARLEHQLARLRRSGGGAGPVDMLAIGREWSDAVGALVDAGRIAVGMGEAELVARLGAPSTDRPGADEERRLTWYFETPMHVNPVFSARIRDGRVAAISRGRM